jgi:hypothetical protein
MTHNNIDHLEAGGTSGPIAQTSLEALAAYKLIRALKERGYGSLVTYGELHDAMGVDPQSSRGRGYLRTARRKALLTDEMVTVCEDNVGVRYLGPRETVNHGLEEQAKVKRRVNWTLRKMATIVPEKAAELKPAERLQFNVLLSSLGALRLCLKPKSQRLIASAVERRNALVGADETLRLFAAEGNGNANGKR